jgi:hypothetical protein
MLEGIERNDHVGGRRSGPVVDEDAAIGDSPLCRQFSSAIEPFLACIDADDLAGALFSERDNLTTLTAAEINDDFAANLVPDSATQELFKLALVLVGGWNTSPEATPAIGAQCAEKPDAKSAANKSHASTSSGVGKETDVQSPNRSTVPASEVRAADVAVLFPTIRTG